MASWNALGVKSKNCSGNTPKQATAKPKFCSKASLRSTSSGSFSAACSEEPGSFPVVLSFLLALAGSE